MEGPEKDPAKLSRRAFLAGGGAALAASGEALAAASESQEAVPAESSNSEWFMALTEGFEDQYERDLPDVLPRASRITNNDPEGRTLMRYAAEALVVAGVSDRVEQELQRYIPALAMVESGYNEDAESRSGAKGILQIMESPWNELKDEGMHRLSMRDQVTVAGRYLSQCHRHLQNVCGKELTHIEEVFFGGDTATYECDFLVPLLINAYNAGMGTAAQLVEWFVEQYPTPESSVLAFEQNEQMTGKDVFFLLSQSAYQQAPVEWYSEHASAYPFKVYAARNVLDRELSREQKEALLA